MVLKIRIQRYKKQKPPHFWEGLSTLDDSVLELFQKDLVTLYDLKEPLLREGLIDYSSQIQIN